MTSFNPNYIPLQAKRVQNLTPVARYDLNDLEANQEFQRVSERFLGSIGEDDDIFEYLRDSDFNLTSAMSRYADSNKFTEQQKKDYAYLRTMFDGADVGSTGQWIELIKDGTVDMVTDPTLILAALFTPFTGGGTLAARATLGKGVAQGLKILGQANKGNLTKAQLAKSIADGTLDQAAKSAVKVSTAAGAIEAGGWMGLHNYANQNIEINTGLRRAFSAKELVGTTAAGAVLGGVIGYGGQKWSNYSNPVLQINNKPKVFKNDTFGNLRLRWNKLWDGRITNLFTGNAARFKRWEDQGVELARTWRGLLDHDSQLGIGKRSNKAIEWSFPEQLNARRGNYMFLEEGPQRGFWARIAPIAPDGVLDEVEGRAIVRFLRGDKSAIKGKSKEVKQVANDLREWYDMIAKDAMDAGYGDIRIENYFPREWNRQAIKDNQPEFIEKLAKDLNISKREAGDIVEGMLDINNDLYASHANLLTHGRKFKGLDDNNYEEFLNNDLIPVSATYGLNAANSIQTKISFGMPKKSKVGKAIDLEGNEILTFQQLRRSKLDEFEERWINPVAEELFEKTGRRMTAKEKQEMRETFESVTGAVRYYGNQHIQGVYDGIKLANAMAYLPLATVSSFSEGLIAASRTSGSKSVKNFQYQMENGLQFLTTDLKSLLKERRGLSEIVANREANRVYLAVDDVQADLTNRLAGDGLQSPGLQRVARTFYKANLLLPWTKTIELAAFNTGRDIVEESLVQLSKLQDAGVKIFDDVDTFVKSASGKDKAIIKELDSIDGVWAGKGNLYKRVTYLKEQVFDMGIDVGEGLNWLNSGASRQSDFWLKNMSMAGGRFARSVILPTSREFSKVPRFMTNPKWDIFTQFLRYPTAFSNTVLKNFVRDTLNNPAMSGPRFAAFIAGATAIARGTNYWRSSEDQQGRYDRFARKTTDKMSDKIFDAFVARSAEENLRAFQRVGLLGPLEYVVRFGDAYRVNPNPLVALSSLGGPVMGDITGTTIYNRGIFEIIARKTPLIGIRNPLKKYTGLDPYAPIIEGARELDTTTRDALQEGFDSVLPRRNYKKGGIVRDGFQNLGRMRYNQGTEVEVNKYVVEGKTFDKETQIRFNNIDNDLKKLGYSRVARAAILGNIHVETGGTFDHQQRQNNGNGYGLYQFDFQKKFYMENSDSYLKANKFEDTPFNQTMFMHESINQLAPGKHTVNKDMIGQLQRDLQGDDVSTAAVSFSKNYLQPGKPHIERRIDASKTIYEILGD
tara:strand:- start:3317 stop:7066 length:3750 start_codon:yes stop_codon:yes gene_type:complete